MDYRDNVHMFGDVSRECGNRMRTCTRKLFEPYICEAWICKRWFTPKLEDHKRGACRGAEGTKRLYSMCFVLLNSGK